MHVLADLPNLTIFSNFPIRKKSRRLLDFSSRLGMLAE